MKIVYHDYGGSHSTATAVAIHLGLISATTVPSAQELLRKVPLFDRLTAEDHGRLYHMGEDTDGNSIYILPRRSQKLLVLNAVKSTISLLGDNPDDWLFIDTIPTVNIWMRIGGYLSRRQGMVALGRPLVTYGTQKAFPHISTLVRQTKKTISSRSGKPLSDTGGRASANKQG